MVNFRRMKLGDLDSIYKDTEIRSIITTSPKDSKFAVVIEEDNCIQGGASGYVIEDVAFIQSIVVKKLEESVLYMDGLIRSVIHFLELDGVELLFVLVEEDSVYSNIGFQKIQKVDNLEPVIRKILIEEYDECKPIYWINLKEFFEKEEKDNKKMDSKDNLS